MNPDVAGGRQPGRLTAGMSASGLDMCAGYPAGVLLSVTVLTAQSFLITAVSVRIRHPRR